MEEHGTVIILQGIIMYKNMLYCNFIKINERWVCGQCGTEIPHKEGIKKPFGLCSLFINNPSIASHVLKKGGTPFGAVDKTREKKYPEEGPGTELKKLLGFIGIQATSNCSCNKKALIMNDWGCDVCMNNIEHILDWLREEASKRKLPFIRSLAKILVKQAIKNARKKLSSSSHL